MRLKSLPYTFKRYGNYYIQIRLSDGRSYKKSLSTDSYREASALMINIIPHLSFVKSLATPIPVFDSFLCNLIASERKVSRNPLLPQQQINVPAESVESQPPAEPEKVLTLSNAWAMYKDEKGRNWTKSISMANERYIEVLLVVLGKDTDVTAISKQDIKQVMEVVENHFLIAEGGQGKTENAARQVVIHPKLIEWGFMEYVDRQWKERIFSEVAVTAFDPPQRLFICYGWLGEKHSAPTANRRSREKRRDN